MLPSQRKSTVSPGKIAGCKSNGFRLAKGMSQATGGVFAASEGKTSGTFEGGDTVSVHLRNGKGR